MALGGGVLAAASDRARASSRPGNFVDLADEGLSPGDDLSPWLDDYWQPGVELHVPGGDYTLSNPKSVGIDSSEDAWLVGDGEVVADHGDTHVEFNIESAGSAHVRVQNFTFRGVDTSSSSNAGKIRAFTWDDAGLTELINVNRPDGSVAGGRACGFFVPNPHAGVVRFINCQLEGFTSDGLYATAFAEGDSNDGMGTVEVYGGLYRNNNVQNIRVGGDDSKVIGAVSVFDDVPNGQDSGNHRGIRVREAGENQVIDDCDIYTAGIDGAGYPVLITDSRFEGPGPSDVRVTNTRIYNDSGKDAVGTHSDDFDVSGDNIHLTGSGNHDLEGAGPRTNVVTGSAATKPRTEKRWYDWGAVSAGTGG